MPDFHPDIKDLIQRMMTVDPSQRIQMSQIKEHPAFRFGLPPSYIVPTPIPFPDFNCPLDVSLVNDDVRNSLNKIGISQEEIEESILSSDTNPVKVFVMLLTRQIQLNELPWEKAESSMNAQILEEATENTDTFGSGVVNQSNLYGRKKPMADISSPDGFSLAQRANWFNVEPSNVIQYDINESFGPIIIPLSQLMNELEQIVLNNNYSFFHPNDLELLGKNERDTYIIIEAVFSTPESITINLQMKNPTQEESETICSAIAALYSLIL